MEAIEGLLQILTALKLLRTDSFLLFWLFRSSKLWASNNFNPIIMGQSSPSNFAGPAVYFVLLDAFWLCFTSILLITIRSSHQRCFVKKVFLEISQNSQESTCARTSFSIKLQAAAPATLLKKRLWHRCFPMNFAKFLRTPFSQNTPGWLLLYYFMCFIDLIVPKRCFELWNCSRIFPFEKLLTSSLRSSTPPSGFSENNIRALYILPILMKCSKVLWVYSVFL